MRVHELAKKLGIESKEALAALNGLGVEVTSVHSAVSEENAARVEQSLGSGAVAKKTATKATKKTAKKATKKAAKKEPTAKKKATKKAATKKVAKKVAKKKPVAVAPEPPAEKTPPATPEPDDAPAPAAAAPEPAPEPKPEPAPVPKPQPEPEPPAPMATVEGPITIEEGITVKRLAEKLGMSPTDVMRELMSRGVMGDINQALDAEAALSIAAHFGAEARRLRADEVLLGDAPQVAAEDLEKRPPVITIMGHVDHGKTLLLDAIRSTNVADREAGGITQHIGASMVEHAGSRITFIDTPGHEAFTRMRLRGAQITDIVVLVVAADDGVMPQTVEAIGHARAAGVPIIVAINKIDLPNANVERVKQQLGEHQLAPESWGGDTVTVEVSAKMKQNLSELLEMMSLTAEMQELTASPTVPARGTVLEAKLDRQRGPVATMIVQEGTLKIGENLVAGMVSGKVRAMIDDRGTRLEEAGPSTAIEVLGLGGVPQAGDNFQVVEATALARKISEIRQERQRQESLAAGSRLTLDDLHAQLRTADRVDISVLIKADVQGSVEVLKDSLAKLSGDKVNVKIIHAAPGGVTESDVLLASASNAIVVGFNVRPERGVADIATREGVDLRLYTIIYQLLDDFKQAMLGRLKPEFRETTLGAAEVRDTFRIPKVGSIAGCYITDGKMTRDAQVRLVRDSVIIFEGKIGSLRRFKDDVSEVQQGFECGIAIANFSDVKIGDVIEAFEVEELEVKL